MSLSDDVKKAETAAEMEAKGRWAKYRGTIIACAVCAAIAAILVALAK